MKLVTNKRALNLAVTIFTLVEVAVAGTARAGTMVKAEEKHKSETHGETSHHPHAHHLAVFTGASSNIDSDHTDFALGGDYEYRLPWAHGRYAAGAFVERVFADESETLAGLTLSARAPHGFKLLLSPALEWAKEHAESAGHGDEHLDTGEAKTTSHFLFRVGLSRAFHLRRLSLSPTLNLDFVNGHKVAVFGLTFGRGF